jgi:FkbM family methyltransferase
MDRQLFVSPVNIDESGAAVLYGAGNVGRDVCRVLTENGIRVVCVLDQRAVASDRWGTIDVYRPEQCPLSALERSRIPLVLSIFNRDVDIAELAQKMCALGFHKVVSFVDLHASFPQQLGDRYWLTDREHLRTASDEIAAAEAVWSDTSSRELYRELLKFRMDGNAGSFLPAPCTDQYFPTDVPNWLTREAVRFVDCGAYCGDTLERLLASTPRVAAFAAFEPDPANFTRLVKCVRDHRQAIEGPAELWPCAVSDRCHPVAFEDGLDEASGICHGGRSRVMAVALSDVLVGWQPTFIKMDIEGAEIDALVGARALIADSKPSLAICAYHRPDHLWRVPLTLSGWDALDGYRFYLRSHGFNGFDTVVYACPQ